MKSNRICFVIMWWFIAKKVVLLLNILFVLCVLYSHWGHAHPYTHLLLVHTYSQRKYGSTYPPNMSFVTQMSLHAIPSFLFPPTNLSVSLLLPHNPIFAQKDQMLIRECTDIVYYTPNYV